MFNWCKVKFVRVLEPSGRSHYLMWDDHPDLIQPEHISCRKVLLRLSCILLCLTEGWLSVCRDWILNAEHRESRALSLHCSGKTNFCVLTQNTWRGSSEYSGFSATNTQRKDSTPTLTLLLSPQPPLGEGEHSNWTQPQTEMWAGNSTHTQDIITGEFFDRK